MSCSSIVYSNCCTMRVLLMRFLFPCAAQAASAAERADNADPPSKAASPELLSRGLQSELWAWDVFISHAGEDKPFAACLHRRLVRIGLRSFLDEDSLRVGGDAPAAMEAAAHSSQIALVLLSEEFFMKPWPQQELRWFLERHRASRSTVVPVFLGITVERCDWHNLKAFIGFINERYVTSELAELKWQQPSALTCVSEPIPRSIELAESAGLAAVCKITGVRQAGEQWAGIRVNQQATLDRIVHELCSLTGVRLPQAA